MVHFEFNSHDYPSSLYEFVQAMTACKQAPLSFPDRFAHSHVSCTFFSVPARAGSLNVG